MQVTSPSAVSQICQGITVSGWSNLKYGSDHVVSGNVVSGLGADSRCHKNVSVSPSISGAVSVARINKIVVANNRVYRSNANGIGIYGLVANLTIKGNDVGALGSKAPSGAAGINFSYLIGTSGGYSGWVTGNRVGMGGAYHGTAAPSFKISVNLKDNRPVSCGSYSGSMYHNKSSFLSVAAGAAIMGSAEYRRAYKAAGKFHVGWNNATSDSACCPASTSCVSLGACYAPGSVGYIAGVKDDTRALCEATSSMWLDVDGGASYCAKAGLPWVKSGAGSNGEYGSAKDGGGGGTECCGDDAGEYYVTACVGSSCSPRCCGKPTDKISSKGTCVQ